MPNDPVVKYFMAMTGNDQARIFSVGLVAGRLIAAWRLRINVSGIIVSIPDYILIRGFRLPLMSENPAPVSIIASEENPVLDICALQAATLVSTGKPIITDGADGSIMAAFEIADYILRRFKSDPLKLLVRAMLMPPFDEIGVQQVPRMSAIIARDAATGPLPHTARAEALPATERPALAARIAGIPNGDIP